MAPSGAIVLVIALISYVSATASIAATSFVTDNGLAVVVKSDHRIPLVGHVLCYRAGGADDPWGALGTAHFLEHLMFKSTDRLSTDEFTRTLGALGARSNAQTNYDSTVYYHSIPKQHLRVVMSLEAERMAHLRFVNEEIAAERDVVLREREATIDASPMRVLGEQMLANLYVNHPYRRSLLGWPGDIRSLTRGDVAQFYKEHYAPNNAVLVVAGDTTEGEVRELVQATYGQLARRPHARPVRLLEPTPVASRRVQLERPGSANLLRYYPTASYASAVQRDGAALDLLAQILGGDDTSQLHQALVGSGLASTATATYVGDDRDGGRFAIHAVALRSDRLERIEKEIDRLVSHIARDGPSEAELSRAKSALEAQRLFGDDELMVVARRYCEGLAVGRTLAELEDEGTLQDVTSADIRAVARRFLVEHTSVTGVVKTRVNEHE
jgi:zinc protease